MSKYSRKIAALRSEITARIVATMRNNNLETLDLLDESELDDPTYVRVRCNSGDLHESVVKRVSLLGDGIELHCSDERVDATLGPAELACNPLERLESVRLNVLQTLGLADDTSIDTGELLRLANRHKTTREDIIREMFDRVGDTTYGELKSKTSYPIHDEEGDKCYITGFRTEGSVLKAMLEYERTFERRCVPVNALHVEKLLGIMLSMINR